MKKHYHYFVSYGFKDGLDTGFGSIIPIRESELNTSTQIQELILEIEKSKNYEAVVILNFILLRCDCRDGWNFKDMEIIS